MTPKKYYNKKAWFWYLIGLALILIGFIGSLKCMQLSWYIPAYILAAFTTPLWLISWIVMWKYKQMGDAA